MTLIPKIVDVKFCGVSNDGKYPLPAGIARCRLIWRFEIFPENTLSQELGLALKK